MKMNDFNKAKSDATEALNIDKNYLKALGRRGESNMRLCCWQEAVDDLQEALRQEPNNVSINKMLMESRRETKRLEELEIFKAKSAKATKKKIVVIEEDDDEEEEKEEKSSHKTKDVVTKPKNDGKQEEGEWWEEIKEKP